MYLIVRYNSRSYNGDFYFDSIVKEVCTIEQARSFLAIHHSDSSTQYVVFKKGDEIPESFLDYPHNAVE